MKGISLKIGVVIVFIISIIYMIKVSGQKVTRGMRNNNPFNIKETDTTWLGEVLDADKTFEGFISLDYGLRAGLINLHNVYFSRGLTLRQIISKYAPASDNNDEVAYLNAVVRVTGVIPEQVPDKSQWLSIASIILKVESGLIMSEKRLKDVVYMFNLIKYL